jgi:hypothetical protein
MRAVGLRSRPAEPASALGASLSIAMTFGRRFGSGGTVAGLLRLGAKNR